MKYSFPFAITLFIFLSSCGSDDSRTCVTCSSSQTSAFTVCEENDGNASVNGDNTGTEYSVYIQGLNEAGANCGE